MGANKSIGILGYNTEEKVYTYYAVNNSNMKMASLPRDGEGRHLDLHRSRHDGRQEDQDAGRHQGDFARGVQLPDGHAGT